MASAADQPLIFGFVKQHEGCGLPARSAVDDDFLTRVAIEEAEHGAYAFDTEWRAANPVMDIVEPGRFCHSGLGGRPDWLVGLALVAEVDDAAVALGLQGGESDSEGWPAMAIVGVIGLRATSDRKVSSGLSQSPRQVTQPECRWPGAAPEPQPPGLDFRTLETSWSNFLNGAAST